MKQVPILPNIVTAFGLTCGLFAIFKINMTPPGEMSYTLLMIVIALLLVAALADLIDGAIARALKQESAFGGLFDSLADSISFGVAPAALALKSLPVPESTWLSFLLTSSAMVYALSGVLRLVRFSVMTDEDKLGGSFFLGLPIPAAAACILSSTVFVLSEDFAHFMVFGKTAQILFLTVMFFSIGYLMISHLHFPSLKTLEIRVSSFKRVFAFVVSAVFLFYGFLYYFPIAFFLCAFGYVFMALLLNFRLWLSSIS